MKTACYENGVKTLTSAYGRVKLSQGFLSILWEAVGHIPDEAWTDIVMGIVKTSLRMPTINQILEAWADWQHNNPRKMMAEPAYDPSRKCFCKGRGYYEFEYIPKWLRTGPPEEVWKNPKLVYRAVCNCGDCKSPRFGVKDVPFIKYQFFDTSKWARLVEPFPVDDSGAVTSHEECQKRFKDLVRMMEDKTYVPGWVRVLAKKYPKDVPLTKAWLEKIATKSSAG